MAGKVTLLEEVVVIVISPTPLVIKLLARVIVFPSLSIPVPPLEPGKIEVIVLVESENFEVNEENA